MIKLSRATKPLYLNAAKEKELTDKFKLDGSPVWRHDDIVQSLLLSSHGKCAYCECSVSEESKYMEVEHYACKDRYPDLVVEWSNLLPACKRCNIAKGVHDVVREPIINPYNYAPKDHLKFRLYRFVGKTELGISTVSALDLNNSVRLVNNRFAIGMVIEEYIEMAADRLDAFKNTANTRAKNKLVGLVETILKECQPGSIYSAVAATVVFTNEVFIGLVSELKDISLWYDYLEVLYVAGKDSALHMD